MKRLLRVIRRVWLRLELRNIEHAIAYEDRHQRSHAERMRYWRWLRASRRDQIHGLEGKHARPNTSAQLAGRRSA